MPIGPDGRAAAQAAVRLSNFPVADGAGIV